MAVYQAVLTAMPGIPALLPESVDGAAALKVIHIPSERPGYGVEISMDGERALAYFAVMNDARKQQWKMDDNAAAMRM